MLKKYPSFFMFAALIIIAPMIMISSNNFYYCWISMELSLFGFIPLFLGMYMESMVKYFVIQASGSAMILISVLMSSNFLYFISIGMKLGLFPFFQWVPMVMTSMSWMGCAVMTTIQKISPLLMINYSNSEFFFYSALMSILIGGFMGVNQTYMRDMMSYSSISHSGWMTISLFISISFFFLYLIVYFSINLMLMKMFSENKTLMTSDTGKESLNTSLLILTILGMPPFSIFFFKCWIVIYLNLTFQILAVMGAAWAAFYYMTIVISNLSVKMNVKNLIIMFILSLINLLILWVFKY